ncbi:MAG TPA: TetR/AcrR family transcriptional regulator [Thermoleophilaceae bacterium]|nr:TetR/AcrR family transcriptional regulator [Thermoleophilaceae bacterium]
MATRPYEQRARAEEAERTRMRIIEAVFTRLREAPAERVAIDQVAHMAGVARSTVYAIFGSRSGLFDAVGRELAARSGYARLLDAKHQPDAREHLRAGFRAASEMLAANRDIYRALRSMAQLDEQAVGGVVRRMDEERGRGMARLAGRLAEQGVLREGLSVEDAEHVLWVLTSFESFDALYTGRGLSTDRAVELLVDTAERALYAGRSRVRGGRASAATPIQRPRGSTQSSSGPRNEMFG